MRYYIIGISGRVIWKYFITHLRESNQLIWIPLREPRIISLDSGTVFIRHKDNGNFLICQNDVYAFSLFEFPE